MYDTRTMKVYGKDRAVEKEEQNHIIEYAIVFITGHETCQL